MQPEPDSISTQAYSPETALICHARSANVYGDYKRVASADFHTAGDGGESDEEDLEADGDDVHDDFDH